MAFNTFATATSDIPLANLDANFTLIGAAAAVSTLYPTASTSITYGTAGTTHYLSGTGLSVAAAATVGTTLGVTGTSTMAAINASGTISGTGTNTWALQSVGATGSLVAGGWLYGSNNGLNFSPNGQGLVKRLTMSYYEAGGGTYREAIGFSNVASGNATVDILAAGGTTNIGGTLGVTGTSTMAAINASGIFTGTGGANIFTSSNSGAANSLTIKNTSNTSGADAVLKASVNSSAGGDPYLLIDTPAIVGWYVGSDTSNSSRFVIGTDIPGNADKLLITTAGAVTIPGTLGVTGATTIGAASAGVGALTINHATQPTIYLAKTNATATTWQIYNNGNLQFYDGTNTPLYFVGAASTFGGAVTMSSGATIGTGSNVLGFKVGWLTANNVKTSSTTLTTLSDLTIAIGAGETWLIEYTLAATSNLEQTGISLQVDTPASAVQDIFYEYIPERYDLVGGLYTTPVGCVFQTASGTLVSWTAADIVYGGKAAINVFVRVTASGAGNVTLGYAQETSTGTNLNILRGSRVKAQRTA